jgi:hypothetical protein
MSQTRIRLDKQIQKAQNANMIPLSDANGELQFVPLAQAVQSAETLTHFDSVEVINGNIVIKYTPENGQQQVLTAQLPAPQQDIHIANAVMENPGAGSYRLAITQNDGSNYVVDLTDLLAVVTQNSDYINLTGNGTNGSPLKAELNGNFASLIPSKLDDLGDVTVNPALIGEALGMQGKVVLLYDPQTNQWVPKSIDTLAELKEVTDVFPQMNEGNAVSLSRNLVLLHLESMKVYRNGLRQLQGEDYTLSAVESNQIFFNTPFTQSYPEMIIVDYRSKV